MHHPNDTSVDHESFRAPVDAPSIQLRRMLPLFLLAALIVTSAGCDSGAKLPQKSSKEYGKVVSAFYVGLAALQVGNDDYAESKFSEVTRLAPGEKTQVTAVLDDMNFPVRSRRPPAG